MPVLEHFMEGQNGVTVSMTEGELEVVIAAFEDSVYMTENIAEKQSAAFLRVLQNMLVFLRTSKEILYYEKQISRLKQNRVTLEKSLELQDEKIEYMQLRREGLGEPNRNDCEDDVGIPVEKDIPF